jgi:hypothetical protein
LPPWQTPSVFYNFKVLTLYQNYQRAINITEPRATSTCDPVSRTCTGQITAPPGFAPEPNTIGPSTVPVADPTGNKEVLYFEGQVLLDQGIAFWTLTYGGFADNLCSQVKCLAENGSANRRYSVLAAREWGNLHGLHYVRSGVCITAPLVSLARFSGPDAAAEGDGATRAYRNGAAGSADRSHARLSRYEWQSVVPPQVVTVKPAETTWVDLNPDAVAILTGLLKIVAPVVGSPPGAAGVAPLEATLGLFDAKDQRGSVLAVHPPEPAEPVPPPSFGLQGLVPGQSIALLVVSEKWICMNLKGSRQGANGHNVTSDMTTSLDRSGSC